MLVAGTNFSLLPPCLPFLLAFHTSASQFAALIAPLSLQCLQPMPNKCVCGADATVLQCLPAIVINPENPAFNTSVPALYADFLQLLLSAQSVLTFRFLAQTLFRGIIHCTKPSGIAS